jgi:uncharacterized membrane protein
MIAEYTYMLDVKTVSGLRKMQYSNLLAFFLLLWLRGFQYLWISYNLCMRVWREKAYTFLTCSIIILSIFSFFNVFVVIVPFFKRTVKWFKKSIPAPEKATSEEKQEKQKVN